MTANNNTLQDFKRFVYHVIKINKHDTIYQLHDSNSDDTFLTNEIKIEKFQGYSKAYNLGHYLRVKNESSWAKSKQITGLFKTQKKGIYYGNYFDKKEKLKTLLIFIIDEVSETLEVLQFKWGYNPHKNVIEKIVERL